MIIESSIQKRIDTCTGIDEPRGSSHCPGVTIRDKHEQCPEGYPQNKVNHGGCAGHQSSIGTFAYLIILYTIITCIVAFVDVVR